jgi:hypothetical protein
VTRQEEEMDALRAKIDRMLQMAHSEGAQWTGAWLQANLRRASASSPPHSAGSAGAVIYTTRDELAHPTRVRAMQHLLGSEVMSASPPPMFLSLPLSAGSAGDFRGRKCLVYYSHS